MKLTKLNDLLEDGKVTKGKWELTPNHELQYKAVGPDEEIKLKGSLIAAEPDALVIGVTERQTDQKIVASLYKLSGAWHANSQNQLVFEVEKEQGKKDAVTFKAGWKIGPTHEIIYAYDQVNLKRKRKISRELQFQGYWDISQKNRLTYFLGGNSESAFRFRGAFQTQSILAKKGEIRYQLGAGAEGKHKLKTITLFGKWKVSRNLDLNFEIEYTDKKRAIAFGGEYALNGNTTVAVNLRSESGEPLGVEIILTRDIFTDGQAFLRLQRSLEESLIEAGMRVKW